MADSNRFELGETTLPTHLIHKRKPLNKCQFDYDKDIWLACKLLAQGKTYKETSDILAKENDYRIDTTVLRRTIQELMVRWKRENLDCIDAIVVKEFLRLEEMERQALEQFEKSKHLRPNEYAILMKRGMTVEEIDDMYAEKEHELAGNPQYLDTLLRIQQRKLQLIGVGSGNDVPQVTINQYNFADADIEDLSKIADRMQDAKLRELTIDEQ